MNQEHLTLVMDENKLFSSTLNAYRFKGSTALRLRQAVEKVLPYIFQ